MRPTLFLGVLLSLSIALAGCGGDDPEIKDDDDGESNVVETNTSSDSDRDSKKDGPSCSLGSVKNCTKCGEACELPKDADEDTTKAVCLGKTKGCGFKCAEGWYDIDTKDDQGCEAEDKPDGTHPKEGVLLHKFSDGDDAMTFEGNLPSDDNTKAKVDKLVVTISDDFGSIVNSEVTLDLGDLPKDGRYAVKVQYICEDGEVDEDPPEITMKGGEEEYWDLDPGCGPDDSGNIVVTIEKKEGEHSAAEYKLTIEP